ncbi:hypothetical protein SDJN02_24825, partial [Cucurbita argyrosperma subsp. argyrosperma]
MHIKINRISRACQEGKSISKYGLLNSKLIVLFIKLCFLMGHDCKNMADERKLLREMNAIQGKDGGMTVEELQAPVISNI